MKVLHAAAEIAGQPALLCRGLRELGVDARSLAFGSSWAQYASDIQLEGAGVSGLWRRLRALIEHARDVDILHLHFGTSFLPRLVDVPFLARRGVKIVFHFHGCDVRPRAETLARHPVSACLDCPVYCSPMRQRRVLDMAAELGRVSIVSTPDLLEAVPGAVHLPVVLDDAYWQTLGGETVAAGDDFVVLHAPSDRDIKGSRYIEAAVRELASRRPNVRYVEVHGVPAAEVGPLFAGATVAVDQLHMGWHGLFGAEAMTLGKPLLVYIRPDLRDYRPELPVVATDRQHLVGDLERLHDDAGERHRLASRGVAYASHEHGLRPVATRLKRLYEERVLGDRAA